MLHGLVLGLCWRGSRYTVTPNPVFPCNVAAAGDEGSLVCVWRLRLRSFHRRIGSPLVFCNVWLFMCAYFYAVLESVVADRIGMAA